MPEPQWLIIAVVLAALLFDFTNGWNDAANAIATVVSTRVLTPMAALGMAAALNIVGAFYSVAVAATVGKGIVDPNDVTMLVVLCALIGGIGWNTAMTALGLPISASHALIGGIVGSTVAHGGFGLIKTGGLQLIFVAMLLSPLLGGVLSYLIMKLLYAICARQPLATVNSFFRKAQLVSVAYMSFTHGTNDAQKVMGIVTMALVAGNYLPTFEVPFWVKISSALVMGLGTAVGGWGVIKTLGMRMLHLKPIHGFAAETGAAVVLTLTAGHGVPVSTTHTITGSILGVGAATRVSAVRWGIATKIIYAWVFTLPGTAAIAYLSYSLLSRWL